MERYIVKQEDLIGDIEGFPIEVVQKMVDYQAEQGNKPDVTVFQKSKSINDKGGGFWWDKTPDGFDFWIEVIGSKNFDLFFKKYPKPSTEEVKQGDGKTKMVRAPFDVEIAKKITNGEIEGNIMTNKGNSVRIVCWDMVSDKGGIIGLEKEKYFKEETAHAFNDEGVCTHNDGLKLQLELPEYLTFKDGDVITFGVSAKNPLIGIFKKGDKYTHECYVALGNSLIFNSDQWIYDNFRLATESEKQKLIDALKASREPEAKECLEKFFGIEETPKPSNSSKIGKKKYEFKPFDKVLVRDENGEPWECNFFSRIIKKHELEERELFMCIDTYYQQCIPYEGNEHLLGTTDDAE